MVVALFRGRAFVEAPGEIVPESLTPIFEETVTSFFPLFIPQDRSPYTGHPRICTYHMQAIP